MRSEKDSMGSVFVPCDAHYGAQTQRAKDNFFDTGLRFPKVFIHYLALIKKCAAAVNEKLGLIESRIAGAIVTASEAVLTGEMDDQFVIDLFQTGSGTSTNMNMNEVIASIANEALTGQKGGAYPVHPNDHVNRGQSSNDVIPTALHLAVLNELERVLLPSLNGFSDALKRKMTEFKGVHKIGRTHLMDAVPISLSDELSAYHRQVELSIERVNGVIPRLSELAVGGTAVGNGLNTHEKFPEEMIDLLRHYTGFKVVEAVNHFEAQSGQDSILELSGVLKTISASLVKISNDLRLMNSGPRCGLGEVSLPDLQPGSSIMPGKVNPVIPESVIQMAFKIMGNDTAITLCAQSGNFELNTTLPLISHAIVESIMLAGAALTLLSEKCILLMKANREKCEEMIEKSLAMVTGLVPYIGYDRAAVLSQKAFESGRSVRSIALEEKIVSKKIIDEVFFSYKKNKREK